MIVRRAAGTEPNLVPTRWQGTYLTLFLRPRPSPTRNLRSPMRSTGLLAAVLLAAMAPGPVAGQALGASAVASVEAFATGTTIQGSAKAFGGGAALLTLGGRFSFGAAAALMLGPSKVEGDGGGSALDLRVSYGGVLLQVRVAGSEDRSLSLRTLVGAGNARIEVPLAGMEVSSDNFGFAEPQLVGQLPLSGPFRLGFGAGYRMVFGVEDLPNLAPRDLQGPSAQLSISVGTR